MVSRTGRHEPSLTTFSGARPYQLPLELGQPAEPVSISFPCGVLVPAQASASDLNGAPAFVHPKLPRLKSVIF